MIAKTTKPPTMKYSAVAFSSSFLVCIGSLENLLLSDIVFIPFWVKPLKLTLKFQKSSFLKI